MFESVKLISVSCYASGNYYKVPKCARLYMNLLDYYSNKKFVYNLLRKEPFIRFVFLK
jgi:hypothetical protein